MPMARFRSFHVPNNDFDTSIEPNSTSRFSPIAFRATRENRSEQQENVSQALDSSLQVKYIIKCWRDCVNESKKSNRQVTHIKKGFQLWKPQYGNDSK
jgi:hypothetical protein